MNDNKDRDEKEPVQHFNLKPNDNPFTNGQSAEEDAKSAKEQIDAEQQFKEAQTE